MAGLIAAAHDYSGDLFTVRAGKQRGRKIFAGQNHLALYLRQIRVVLPGQPAGQAQPHISCIRNAHGKQRIIQAFQHGNQLLCGNRYRRSCAFAFLHCFLNARKQHGIIQHYPLHFQNLAALALCMFNLPGHGLVYPFNCSVYPGHHLLSGQAFSPFFLRCHFRGNVYKYSCQRLAAAGRDSCYSH